MAEKIVSPGVFTNEIDQSFLPAAVAEIGAAVVGPTVKGPSLVPTVVTSYSEFVQHFGDTFKSGSSNQAYLTSVAAKEYLKNADKLTVVRILDGTVSAARGFVSTGSNHTTAGLGATNCQHYTGSRTSASFAAGATSDLGSSFDIYTLAEGKLQNTTPAGSGVGFDFNVTGSGATHVYFTGSADGSHAKQAGWPNYITTDGLLVSGSKHNLRWEVTNINRDKGTFTLLVRQGNDTVKRKQILETWNNLTLDPNSNNYISKIIGDQYASFSGTSTDPYLTYNGNYPNKSKYVYISDVKDTVDYLDENGNVRVNAASASLPGIGSGSIHGVFSGADSGFVGLDSLGNVVVEGGYVGASPTGSAVNLYENIALQSQGFAFSSATSTDGTDGYLKALSLLNNQDEYDVNMILIPGIVDNVGSGHTTVITKAIDVCEDRGDCFLIYDTVAQGETSLTTVTSKAEERDTNYAATYWPWVKVNDSQNGVLRWVPPSVVLPGIYAFNDKVAAPWFAPAGLNRGGLDTVIQTERKLTHANRDTLYESNVNPIATFPGQGVCVWGQKTLQKKASALDRVNVRRLLIKLKKFIAASSRFLVFEQNNNTTRNRFLNIVNPYLEQVQSNAGLSAFKVVMDDTNNTPDIVDRNILYGQLFLQPTKTAEFIVLDFTVQPTGATFPE